MRHLLLPGVPLDPTSRQPVYVDYLKAWRENVVTRADDGEVASSCCLQAAIIDLVLAGEIKHDWLGIMDEYLVDDGKPLAYSTRYGARLYGFDSQYRQTTIHAIHARWWLETVMRPKEIDHERFAALLQAKKQSDGLIYDADVSETVLRHRMKSELTLSAAMSVEILRNAGRLSDKDALALATNITDPKKCPPLGYLGMEYFRLQVLQQLRHESLFPDGIDDAITACEVGLPAGWCDFSIVSKVDAYMGTAKRTSRDKPIHAPLTALHVRALLERLPDGEKREKTRERLVAYANHLAKQPMDIPAFQMRDVPIPFGADRTPIEVICASNLMATCAKA